ELVRSRTRELPLHPAYLADDEGRVLIHPDPARQRQVRLASAGLAADVPRAEDDEALHPFAPHLAEGKQDAAQLAPYLAPRDERGRTRLPGGSFYHTRQPFLGRVGQRVYRGHWKELDATLVQLARDDVSVRYALLPEELQLDCSSAEGLEAARQQLVARQRELGLADPPSWEPPVHYREF